VPATKPAHCFFSLTAGPRPALLHRAPALDLSSLASHFTFETSSCKSFVVFPSPLSLRFSHVQFYFTLVERSNGNYYSPSVNKTRTQKRYVVTCLSSFLQCTTSQLPAHDYGSALHYIASLRAFPTCTFARQRKRIYPLATSPGTATRLLSLSSTFPNQFSLPSHPKFIIVASITSHRSIQLN
jgi:hypothetical protein